MFGNMMDQPLLISSLLTHAERHHGSVDDFQLRRRQRLMDGELAMAGHLGGQ